MEKPYAGRRVKARPSAGSSIGSRILLRTRTREALHSTGRRWNVRAIDLLTVNEDLLRDTDWCCLHGLNGLNRLHLRKARRCDG